MHVELLVPSLLCGSVLPADTSAPPDCPALECLLARGRRTDAPEAGPEQWLMNRFFADDEVSPPAGVLTLLAYGEDPGDAQWVRADPVHLRLGRDRAILVPAAAIGVTIDESRQLCAALEDHFAPAHRFRAFAPEGWCMSAPPGQMQDAANPLAIAGMDVDTQLRNNTDTRWHALLNEIQMVLHDHPVNAAREHAGEPAINSVCFWGAAPLPAGATSPWRGVHADDPIALGLAHAAATPGARLPVDARAWLRELPPEGRTLVVLDALRIPIALGDAQRRADALMQLERAWFAPLLEALRGGRIGMVTIHATAPGTAIRCETIRTDLRRFWRRVRPLASYCTAY